MGQITVQTLLFFRDCLAKTRGKSPVHWRSSASVHQCVCHIQYILDKAGPRGRRNRDAAGLIPEPPWIKPPRVDVTPPRIVPPEHFDMVYRAAVAMDVPRYPGIKAAAWWRALLVTAYETALRRRSLLTMRMDHIDWQRRRLILPPGFVKTHTTAIVPLNNTAMEHLLAIRTDRELVFPWPLCKTSYHHHFHRLLKAAAVEAGDRFQLQAIRKTICTLLWETSPQAAQFALGHSTDRVTRDYYVAGGRMMTKAFDDLPQPAAFVENVARVG